MLSETIARVDTAMRPLLLQLLPKWLSVYLYSSGRNGFLKLLTSERPSAWSPPPSLARTLWGIRFNAPLFNAAGMFKTGEGYDLVARQGAGAYLAGTSTANPRSGNVKLGIRTPFIPYPRSGAASNWLGLPNLGHTALAKRLAKIEIIPGCPVGVSVSADPTTTDHSTKLGELVLGMHTYVECGVDFIELNESCPNTEQGSPQQSELLERLEFIKSEFIDKRSRMVPVIVKFSTDTELSQIPDLIKLLVELRFDGVNLGNTSTNYSELVTQFATSEQPLLQYFTRQFGGGISGKPLFSKTLALVTAAKEILNNIKPDFEFHIVGTGGVSTRNEAEELLAAGASLIQWYTGYFESFGHHGHSLYRAIFSS